MMHAILLLLLLTPPAIATPVHSDEAACARLKQKLLPRVHLRRPVHVTWRCDIDHETGLYVIDLHADHPCPITCSTLFGWFAVRKHDGEVGEWDINNDRLMPLRARY